MSAEHRAKELFDEAFRHQREGNLDEAIKLYKQSIRLHPTAEAHTFLGWTYSWQGRIPEAIAECKQAIAVDPTLGNPYNDIGVYLITQGRLDEAIPWLERATKAERYESPQFPWLNLGRVYTAKELYRRAIDCFQRALEIAPDDETALEALDSAQACLN